MTICCGTATAALQLLGGGGVSAFCWCVLFKVGWGGGLPLKDVHCWGSPLLLLPGFCCQDVAEKQCALQVTAGIVGDRTQPCAQATAAATQPRLAAAVAGMSAAMDDTVCFVQGPALRHAPSLD
jgi:hypothetical protein